MKKTWRIFNRFPKMRPRKIKAYSLRNPFTYQNSDIFVMAKKGGTIVRTCSICCLT